MKKNLLTLILLFIGACHFGRAFAQAPQGIPYQAIARDTSGSLIANQSITLQLSVHDVTANGTVSYRETHSVTTNALGLFTVNIGQGTPDIGTFSAIAWGNGDKFLQVELDITGGNSFTDMGTTQLMSVPYALYAANSGNGWSMDGNSNTNPSTHFLGTTDSNDLVIKTDNLETARFLSNPVTAAGIIIPEDRLRITRSGMNSNKWPMAAGFQLGSYDGGMNAATQLDIALSNGPTTVPENKIMSLTADGRVGILNTTPSEALDVNGTGRFGPYLKIGTDVAEGYFQNAQDGAYRARQAGGTQGYWFQNYNGINTSMYVGLNGDYQGKVGIGTTTPSGKLEITPDNQGDELIVGEPVFNSNDAANRIQLGNSSNSSFMRIGQSNTNFLSLGWLYNANPDSAFAQVSTFSPTNPLALQRFGGKVGIGTVTPQTLLDLSSNATAISLSDNDDGSLVQLIAPGNGATGGLGTANNFDFPIFTNNADRLTVKATGEVGIGTSNPWGQLHVKSGGYPNLTLEGSSVAGTWFSMGNTSAGGQWFNQIATGSANGEGPGKLLFTKGSSPSGTAGLIMALDHATSFVGIGTTTPTSRLEVMDVAAGSATPAVRIHQNNCGPACGQTSGNALQLINDNTSGVNSGARLSFAENTNVANNDEGAATINLVDRDVVNGYGGLGFSTRNASGNFDERMRIAKSGNVGIGLNDPDEQLTVLSTVKIRANNSQGGNGIVFQEAPYVGNGNWHLEAYAAGFPAANKLRVYNDRTGLTQLSIMDNGNVGIGDFQYWEGAQAKLDVKGNVKIADGTEGAGKVLTSDANGNASWTTPAALVETDPKVGTLSVNTLPKWNGSTLADGILYENASHIGLGNTTAQHILSIGNATTDGQVVAIRGYSNEPLNWKGGAAFGYNNGSVMMGELNGVPTIGGHDATLSGWNNLSINPGGGNVGIGTANPTNPLSVAGNADVSGSMTAASLNATTANVTNINSSKFKVTQVWNEHQNLPDTSNFTCGGGTLLLNVSGMGYRGSVGTIGFNILVDNVVKGTCKGYTNEINSQKVICSNFLVLTGVAPGLHAIKLAPISPTLFDINSYFSVTVLELPY